MKDQYPLTLDESALQRVREFPGLDTLVTRNNAPEARFSMMDQMFVERGNIDDWWLLHDLHYKAEKLPIGPHFWRLRLQQQTIGVLVTAVPKGMVRERHIVFPNIKPGAGETRLTNSNRYGYLNQHFRTVSRFVVDTMYRGIGAGYRAMNLIARMEQSTFVEIQSSMSKFNSFGQKAGFRFVKPMNANNYEKVMKFLRLNFESAPQDYEAIMNEIATRSPEEQQRIFETARDFYFKNSALENTTKGGSQAEKRAESMTMRSIIRAIQQLGLASPMYGVWKNPDIGRELPDCLPLTQFDMQGPNEKLRL